MHIDVNFLSLSLIFLVAFCSPIIARRIKFLTIPEVIIQILVGFVLGKSGFGLIKPSDTISFLSTLGFAFLMFLSGYEVDFRVLKKAKVKSENNTNTFKNAFLIMTSTMSLALMFATILFLSGLVKSIPLMSLIFSTTALGIVVPVLKEKGLINNAFGQTMLVSALLADFSTLFLLPEVMILVKGKMDYAVFYPCILFAFFIVFYAILIVMKETKILKAIKQTDFSKGALRVSHLDVRMVMPVLFIFAMLASSLGIEVIVGAFMAGMLFSLILKKGPDTESLSEKLDSIGFGFLIPIFFIMIGASFKVASLFSREALVMLPIFLVIAYVVKLISCFFILKKEFGILKSISAGFLLSSRLSLIIALSAIALQSGVITNSMYSTLIIVAIITCLLSPVISMKLYLKSELPSGTEQIAAVVS